jgi:hypothetical protein
MRKSLVSIVALGLFAGAPVMAQTTTYEATTNQTATQQQTTQQQATLSDQQFQDMLSGYEERSELEGRIARAMTADGNDVFVLVGPRDLEPDESFEAQDSDVRDRFEQAGFTGVQVLGSPRLARANLDEDHYIFAFSADQIWRPGMQTGGLTGEPGTGIGQDDTRVGQMDTDIETELGQTGTEIGRMDTDAETGQIGRALSEADADRMVSDIEGAGIQNADQFQGRLVRAMSNGAPVFFLITSRDMSADAEVDISEDEVRQKLQEADLQNIEFVDDVAFVRGDFDDDSVFVLAGDLMGRGMQQ